MYKVNLTSLGEQLVPPRSRIRSFRGAGKLCREGYWLMDALVVMLGLVLVFVSLAFVRLCERL